MYLIQILLPLYTKSGERSGRDRYARVRGELVARFGGLTAYTRSPATGVWEEDRNRSVHDDIVIYEVMTKTLDEAWWRTYRADLEQRFEQEQIVVRAQEIRLL